MGNGSPTLVALNLSIDVATGNDKHEGPLSAESEKRYENPCARRRQRKNAKENLAQSTDTKIMRSLNERRITVRDGRT